MKKIGLIVLMMGIAMNSYGMDLESERPADESRKPFSNKYIYPNSLDVENPYPECSQYVQTVREEFYLKGFEEGRQSVLLKVATRMFEESSDYTHEFITEITGVTEEQLKDIFSKEMEKDIVVLPPLPGKFMDFDGEEANVVVGSWLGKSNESYRILEILEQPNNAKMIKRGVSLLLEAAQEGCRSSLEKLANMALYGQYNVPKDVEWGFNALIYLTEDSHGMALNTLNAVDQIAVSLLKEGKKEEALQLFIKTWTERKF